MIRIIAFRRLFFVAAFLGLSAFADEGKHFALDRSITREGDTTKIAYRFSQDARVDLLQTPEGQTHFLIEAASSFDDLGTIVRREISAGQRRFELWLGDVRVETSEAIEDPCCDGFWNGFAEGWNATIRGETLKEDLGAYATGAIVGPLLQGLMNSLPASKLLALGGLLAGMKDFMVSRQQRYAKSHPEWSDSFVSGRIVFDVVKDLMLSLAGLSTSNALARTLEKAAAKSKWAAWLWGIISREMVTLVGTKNLTRKKRADSPSREAEKKPIANKKSEDTEEDDWGVISPTVTKPKNKPPVVGSTPVVSPVQGVTIAPEKIQALKALPQKNPTSPKMSRPVVTNDVPRPTFWTAESKREYAAYLLWKLLVKTGEPIRLVVPNPERPLQYRLKKNVDMFAQAILFEFLVGSLEKRTHDVFISEEGYRYQILKNHDKSFTTQPIPNLVMSLGIDAPTLQRLVMETDFDTAVRKAYSQINSELKFYLSESELLALNQRAKAIMFKAFQASHLPGSHFPVLGDDPDSDTRELLEKLIREAQEAAAKTDYEKFLDALNGKRTLDVRMALVRLQKACRENTSAMTKELCARLEKLMETSAREFQESDTKETVDLIESIFERSYRFMEKSKNHKNKQSFTRIYTQYTRSPMAARKDPAFVKPLMVALEKIIRDEIKGKKPTPKDAASILSDIKKAGIVEGDQDGFAQLYEYMVSFTGVPKDRLRSLLNFVATQTNDRHLMLALYRSRTNQIDFEAYVAEHGKKSTDPEIVKTAELIRQNIDRAQEHKKRQKQVTDMLFSLSESMQKRGFGVLYGYTGIDPMKVAEIFDLSEKYSIMKGKYDFLDNYSLYLKTESYEKIMPNMRDFLLAFDREIGLDAPGKNLLKGVQNTCTLNESFKLRSEAVARLAHSANSDKDSPYKLGAVFGDIDAATANDMIQWIITKKVINSIFAGSNTSDNVFGYVDRIISVVKTDPVEKIRLFFIQEVEKTGDAGMYKYELNYLRTLSKKPAQEPAPSSTVKPTNTERPPEVFAFGEISPQISRATLDYSAELNVVYNGLSMEQRRYANQLVSEDDIAPGFINALKRGDLAEARQFLMRTVTLIINTTGSAAPKHQAAHRLKSALKPIEAKLEKPEEELIATQSSPLVEEPWTIQVEPGFQKSLDATPDIARKNYTQWKELIMVGGLQALRNAKKFFHQKWTSGHSAENIVGTLPEGVYYSRLSDTQRLFYWVDYENKKIVVYVVYNYK